MAVIFVVGRSQKWNSARQLAHVFFLIYINDLIKYRKSYSDIYLFADDAKIFRHMF